MKSVTIDTLYDEWAKDAPIDQTEPHKALERIPRLHQKYQTILSNHRLRVKNLEFDYNEMRRWKTLYYQGLLNNPDDMTKYNIQEPYPTEHKNRDIDGILAADEDLTKLVMKKVIQEEIVDYCKSILKELNNRTWALNAIIKWRTFTNDTTISEDEEDYYQKPKN